MATEWMNYYQNAVGQWIPNQPVALDYYYIDMDLNPPGRAVRLHSSSVGGQVVLVPHGASVASYGDVEVYARILFADNTFRYISAPLRTPVDVQNVQSLRLGVVLIVGAPGATSVDYRAYFNANLVYEYL
ncbi:hypothetical protein [Streptomyces phaeochromogenes]|uniref:hypothetical protein n=1 Tax=Streptomyces phaeochromogenes TaxID=1923 RepID=UPI0033D9C51D